MSSHYLTPLFEPRSVALVGVSDNPVKVGGRMLENLIAVARDRGLRTMAGWVLSGNRGMLDMVTRMGFETTSDPDDPHNVTVTLAL